VVPPTILIEIYIESSSTEYLKLWCKVLFKIAFRLKMHQNEFFFRFCFKIFDISTSKPPQNTKKNINLMFFQAKNTFEKHLEVVAEVMLNSIVYVVLTWWVQI